MRTLYLEQRLVTTGVRDREIEGAISGSSVVNEYNGFLINILLGKPENRNFRRRRKRQKAVARSVANLVFYLARWRVKIRRHQGAIGYREGRPLDEVETRRVGQKVKRLVVDGADGYVVGYYQRRKDTGGAEGLFSGQQDYFRGKGKTVVGGIGVVVQVCKGTTIYIGLGEVVALNQYITAQGQVSVERKVTEDEIDFRSLESGGCQLSLVPRHVQGDPVDFDRTSFVHAGSLCDQELVTVVLVQTLVRNTDAQSLTFDWGCVRRGNVKYERIFGAVHSSSQGVVSIEDHASVELLLAEGRDHFLAVSARCHQLAGERLLLDGVVDGTLVVEVARGGLEYGTRDRLGQSGERSQGTGKDLAENQRLHLDAEGRLFQNGQSVADVELERYR